MTYVFAIARTSIGLGIVVESRCLNPGRRFALPWAKMLLPHSGRNAPAMLVATAISPCSRIAPLHTD